MNKCPAQLWIGSPDSVAHRAVGYAQRLFCKNGACGHCIICVQVARHQYHDLSWLTPEGSGYTIAQLLVIKDRVRFALDAHQTVLFVIESAEMLSHACANSLLKVIEEPPPGYFFILLAQRRSLVVPTVASRCVITDFNEQGDQSRHILLQALLGAPQLSALKEFARVYDSTPIEAHETLAVLDCVLNSWAENLKKLHKNTDEVAYARQEKGFKVLQIAYNKLPLPGSAALFWRWLFMALASC